MNESTMDVESHRQDMLGKDYKRLNKIIDAVSQSWERYDQLLKQNFADEDVQQRRYPHKIHDENHCLRVEQKLYELIPADKLNLLSQTEKFVLLAAIWLNGIGMNPYLDCQYATQNENEANTLETLEDALWYDKKVRDSHHERSVVYIQRNASTLGLKPFERDYVMRICRLHRHGSHQSLEREDLEREDWGTQEKPPIRLKLLVAYLRLAATIHVDSTDSSINLKTYLALGLDPTARFHWLKSKYVKKISLDPKTLRIIITLRIPDNRAYPVKKYVSDAESWTGIVEPLGHTLELQAQDELDSIRDILAQGGLSFYYKVTHDEEKDQEMSAAEVQQLQELIHNIELFDPTMTPNAGAIIDSVLKQIELFVGNPAVEASKGIDYISDYKRHVLDAKSKSAASFMLLGNLSEILAKILQADGLTDTQRLELIKKEIERLKEKRQAALKKIPKEAYYILEDGKEILLYGYSQTIIKCIEYFLETSPNIDTLNVYICEGRTKTIYRYNNRLVYSDAIKYAQELVNAQNHINAKLRANRSAKKKVAINIKIVTDAAVSYLFSNRHVSKVLFGANGIDFKGNVAHSLGHAAIADAASVHDVQVYVIADSMKIGTTIESKSTPRGNQWLTTDTEFETFIDGLDDCNPHEEILIPQRIMSIVTEHGMVNPSDVWQHTKLKRTDSQTKRERTMPDLEALLSAFDFWIDDFANKKRDFESRRRQLEKVKQEIEQEW